MNLQKRVKNIFVIKATTLFFIPLFLIIATGEVRESISDYAYSSADSLFVLLLTIAGTLFINNGITSHKWYNAILGVSLLGVALTPHLEYPFLHYTFAGVFFLGSVFVMLFYSSRKQRKYKIIAAIVIIIALLGILFGWYSILIAEWIGLLPICLHFIGESLNIID